MRVFIGIGGNVADPFWGPPVAVLTAATEALSGHGIPLLGRSRWYLSAAVPPSDQPPCTNAVLEVAPDREPDALLQALHAVEAAFGRRRGAVNAARILTSTSLLSATWCGRMRTACNCRIRACTSAPSC